MFFANCSVYEGERARLYRTPARIKEDIFDIKTKIEAATAMLNVRSVLTEVMCKYAQGEPEEWIPALADIVADAEESLESLRELKECLELLTEELEDTKWVLGI